MHLKTIFTACFLIFSTFLFAQKKEEKIPNYDKIDAYVKNVPFLKTIQIDTLASYLLLGASKPRDKARAIYTWVSSNIIYDDVLLDSLNSPWASPDVIRSQQPDNVLIFRTAICQGYAELFKALADKMGLRAEVVVGAVKDENGEVPRFGHAWNVVKIGAEWELIDPTWGANSKGVIDEKYFFTAPEDMILDHLPFDPMWQLTANPMPLSAFKNADDKTVKKLFTKNPKNEFVFRDTISRYFRLDTLMRLYKSSDRMLRFNADNEYVTFEVGKANYYRFIQMSDKINRKLGEALDDKNVEMDSTRFEARIAAKWAYYQKTLDCFNQIKDDVFQEKVKKGVFSTRQIDGLKKYDRGLYQTTVFFSKRGASSKSENGLNELDKHIDYSFRNLKSAVNSFDTLAETKFRVHTDIALHYQINIKAKIINDYISYFSEFMDDQDYFAKNKKKIKNMIVTSEQHYRDAVPLIDRQEKLDTASTFKKNFRLLKIILDYSGIEYDLQADVVETKPQDMLSLASLDKKEAFYNAITTRIEKLKEDTKSVPLKQQTIYLNGIQNVEMSNDFRLAKTWLSRCLIDAKIDKVQAKLYVANCEHYLLEGEKLFKNVKGQREDFYKVNQNFIAQYKKSISMIRATL